MMELGIVLLLYGLAFGIAATQKNHWLKSLWFRPRWPWGTDLNTCRWSAGWYGLAFMIWGAANILRAFQLLSSSALAYAFLLGIVLIFISMAQQLASKRDNDDEY